MNRITIAAVALLAGSLGWSMTARATVLPASVDDPVLWLDAGNINGADNAGLVDGGSVGTWVNVAPGAGDSATGTSQPTYVAQGLNGLPVVRFAGTNRLFDSEPALNITGNALTVFILMHQTSIPVEGFNFNYGGSSTGYYLSISNGEHGYSFFAGGFLHSGVLTAAPNLNQPLIVGGMKDATSQTLYVNGSTFMVGTVAPILSSPAPVAVGDDGRGFPDGGDGNWPGDYRHVLIYDRALSSEEITTLQTFLQTQVPEPASALLLAAGAGLLPRRRRE